MMESPDFTDPTYGMPVFSLYGEVRRPKPEWMGTFDVVLIDLQDLGCRIYTFITTLLYMLEAGAKHGKSVWVLDRPNPRSEEHTSELQSLMRISYAVFCLKKKKKRKTPQTYTKYTAIER